MFTLRAFWAFVNRTDSNLFALLERVLSKWGLGRRLDLWLDLVCLLGCYSRATTLHLLEHVEELLSLLIRGFLKICSGFGWISGLLSLLHHCKHVVTQFAFAWRGRCMPTVVHALRVVIVCWVQVVLVVVNSGLGVARWLLVVWQHLQVVLHYVFLLRNHFRHKWLQDFGAKPFFFSRVWVTAPFLMFDTLIFVCWRLFRAICQLVVQGIEEDFDQRVGIVALEFIFTAFPAAIFSNVRAAFRVVKE